MAAEGFMLEVKKCRVEVSRLTGVVRRAEDDLFAAEGRLSEAIDRYNLAVGAFGVKSEPAPAAGILPPVKAAAEEKKK